MGGKRGRRIDLAQAELEATEAEIADRERRLIAEVRVAYAEAVAAIRELEITESINLLDHQTARVVEVRVMEGESAPIEANLLQAEVERAKARRALIEGKLQTVILRLKNLAGLAPGDPMRLRDEFAAPELPEPPPLLEAAVDVALKTRPDLRLARLNEEVAQAGLRLARAQRSPDVTAFTRYTKSDAVFDDTPVGILRDKDRLLTFGVSISIPLFNRNQGAKAEAEAAITQARKRREFAETVIRAQVASAYARYEAAKTAVTTLAQGVLARSQQNITAVRGAYEIGAFRITDLLVEQRRFLDAQREFIEALAERYRALADVQSALGTPVKP
jgi:cobalt-zinc-cadmium efflux system outer membrane protein